MKKGQVSKKEGKSKEIMKGWRRRRRKRRREGR